MVDRILDFSINEHTQEEVNNFQDEIISIGNPRYIFLFSKYIKKANIDLLSQSLLNTNDKRYIHFFVRTIRNINYEKFIDKILEYNDSKYLFYVAYDTSDLPEKYLIKICKKIYELNDKEYLSRLLYYYFYVLKLKNIEMFEIFKRVLKDYNINDVTLDNCCEILKLLEKQMIKKYNNENVNKKEFCKNCYKGRKSIIPDMIVCHISSNYEKMINTFYDEKSEVSSHFVIATDGRIKQMVDLDDSSWANGTSLNQDSDVYYKFSTSKIVRDRKENANYYTFSIEHESIDGNLTNEQYDSTILVMKQIINYIKRKYNYDFQIDRYHIVGHNEVSPIVRTKCPGKKFPFDKIIKDLNLIYKLK